MTENEAKIFIQNAMEQSRNVLAELMLIMPKVFAAKRKSLGEYYSNLENCKKEIQACEVAVKALEDVQKYRAIEKDLKERYHANVDIPLLMHHFIETVFEGEKHEGFCLLTNEDAKAWEEYKAIGTPEELITAMKYVRLAKAHRTVGKVIEECAKYEEIGTPEECRAAVEKQTETLTVDKAKTIAAKAICAGCGYLTGYECSYKGGNCMTSKPMLESVYKYFDDWNRRMNDETD